MGPLALLTATILGASTSISVLAQESQITWAAFTYSSHGEKAPSITSGPFNLTPLGAQQALRSGTLIRDRYISAPENGSQLTTSSPIHGLSVDAISNEQLVVLSTDDEFVSASALAFMQGLYPPRGLVLDAESILGNGTLEQFPLGGYQYPNVGTLGGLDFNYIWLAGNIGCNKYDINTAKARQSPLYNSLISSTEPFYQSLNQSLFWAFDPTYLSYSHAYELYEYALFQYTHNQTIQNTTGSDITLTKLYNLASQQQWYFNSHNATSANTTSINTIAGRTLASKVLQQFQHTIASNGVSDKLTSLFGSHEPMLSFFSLSLLSTGPAAARFTSIPLPSSTLAFELFSYSTTAPSADRPPVFPPTEDLFVRFLFRNGTGETDPLIAYPLFGRGNSQVDLPWRDFVGGMGGFGIEGVEEWCGECAASTLYCEAISSSSSSASQSSSSSSSSGAGADGIHPVVAGVIGAAVTISFFIVLMVVLLLFGFRIGYRRRSEDVTDKNETGSNSGSGNGIGVLKRSGSAANGGFKGKEKLASDLDLASGSSADGGGVVRHERVGSWELRDSPTSGRGEGGGGRVRSLVDYSRRSAEAERDVGDLHGLRGVEEHEHV